MAQAISSCIIYLIITPLLAGNDIYVSPNGNDIDDGRKARPLKSLKAAASKLSAVDTIVLRGGRYAGPVALSRLRGSVNKPIVIRSYPGAEVMFDGTDPLDGQWKHELGPPTDSIRSNIFNTWQRTCLRKHIFQCLQLSKGIV